MRTKTLLLLVATMLAACAESNINEALNNSVATDKIYATIAETEDNDDTRVELNERRQTVWTEGDQIVTYSNDEISIWEFDGKTGDRSGSFSYVTSHGAPSADFVDYDKYYAIYPATEIYLAYEDKTPAFFTIVPAIQEYKKDSYGVAANAMLGTSYDGKDYEFKNIFGYLRLSITGNKVVKRIELSGNNNEYIAGELIANINAQLVQWWEDVYTTATIDCGDGVQLTDIPTNFYFTVPTITLTEGINVVVYFTDGTIFPKRTSKSITFYRNTIQPMATFDTGGDVEWQTLTIEHSGDVISTPQLYGSTALAGYIYWGDGYMSELNTGRSYVYDDGEESHTITIKALNATSISLDSCEGINTIDLSQF